MLALYITVLYSYIVFFFIPKTFKKKFTCSESVVQEKRRHYIPLRLFLLIDFGQTNVLVKSIFLVLFYFSINSNGMISKKFQET